MVFVEGLGVALVEVDDHRILLVGIEVGRFINHAFQRASVERDPGDQLCRTPQVIRLLTVAVAYLYRFLETEVGAVQVGEGGITLDGIKHLVRLLGLLDGREHVVACDQLLGG